jgi:hypothetical protein
MARIELAPLAEELIRESTVIVELMDNLSILEEKNEENSWDEENTKSKKIYDRETVVEGSAQYR